MNHQQFLQRYQFNVRTDRLGGGTFGTVYLAYDTTRDRYVAIKVAEVKTVNGKTFSLEDELKAVSGLPEHRNLAHYENVYQFESPAGIFDYAVMQYYPAGNLRQLLDKGQLSAQQRLGIATGLLKGLSHLHKHGVIHRDLKPSNILIAKVKEQYIPKIADFGLSKQVGEGSRFTNSLTGGTLAYSAPEQLLGRPLRLNADLWSAGVLLFELFLGYRPFRPQAGKSSSAARDRELFDQIVNAPLPPEAAQIPKPFAEAVTAFLVKSPEERANRILPHWIDSSPLHTADKDEGTLPESALSDDKEALPPDKPKAASSRDAEQTPSRKWLPILFGALVAVIVSAGGLWWYQHEPVKPTPEPKQDATGKWGYTDEAGTYLIPAVYDSAGLFYGGFAQVIQGDSTLRINETGALDTVLSVDTALKDTISPEPAVKQETDPAPTAEEVEAAAWSKAEATGDIAAYEAYLVAYPAGAHARQAKTRLQQLRDEAAWSEAKRRDTESSYESYLRDYPDGGHAREARSRLEELHKPALPEAIQALERNMVRVPGGSFTMGCTSEQSDCDDDESPTHRVELSSFSIGKFEVTQAQWEAVMGSNPSKFSGCKSCPVEKVSWNDVQDFIDKLNRMTGGNYRLPTEAEWEYAARGGSRSRGHKYSGSDNLGSVGWYYSNSDYKTHPVGKKSPNELGLYDMSGNVYEWCSDWYDKDYYSSSPARNPKGPGGGSDRVIRGGDWIISAWDCRVSYRGYDGPDNRHGNLGFRLAAP
ncbi:bifunctional serine/threonine-protein kinase/formylglycine-generating enzyme family protein [Phaeodactylibacter xiamenensis]|uniref:bifunctional serine/threonine-protein kinase/formylglycine-generating enzyme family protein n=1 Tax=Phaeodactylibacter xiamenensis TaxID=1524460 RepID=UPI0024A8E94A|nr:bifunctional serine/threonine-protein kinase/formylglycine-generating enzyme family protein [Phaeodactylibacter xiamenensis]